MPSTTLPMPETYPQPINLDRRKLADTIDTLTACSKRAPRARTPVLERV